MEEDSEEPKAKKKYTIHTDLVLGTCEEEYMLGLIAELDRIGCTII